MMEFMKTGGVAMWLILALGVAVVGLAGSFAWNPSERKLGLVRPLSVALVFLSVAGTAAGIAATMTYVTRVPEFATDPKLPLIVLTGIGESITPLILGFTILTTVWLTVTLGLRRQL